MKICKVCILNENFPGISFNENGICHQCQKNKTKVEQNLLCKKYEKKFLELIEKYKDKSSYDCVVAYSGGKDSTYMIYLLKEKYNLNILALRYDNWFQSELAYKNIERIVQNLDIDLITVKPRYDLFRKIIQSVVNNEFYSIKHIQRASDICTTCISLIRLMCLKTAIEKEIPFVIFGMSPGQAPIVTSIVKTNPQMNKKMQDIIYQPLSKKLGDEIKPYFLGEEYFKKAEFFPYILNPLAFLKYDEKEILKIINSIGWKRPKDTDSNSTNCLLNAFANNIHKKKYGFHPYSYELAELVRTGKMDRETALIKINETEEDNVVESVKKELKII